jgi:hypothetical protein
MSENQIKRLGIHMPAPMAKEVLSMLARRKATGWNKGIDLT